MIWDNHACLPMERGPNLSFLPQLERYRAAGVDVVSLNVGYGGMSLDEHLRLLAQMRTWILERPDAYALVGSTADLDALTGAGRLGVVFDIEGAAPLEGQVELVDALHVLGVRWMLLAYNRGNAFGSGCHDPVDNGLTRLGEALVDRMAKVGMVVCLSHTGYRTARQALDRAERPMVFSHSNPRALHDHPRNIPDDLIDACAARGGVIGVNGLGLFLGGAGATAARVADHIDYIVQRVGPTHVGLGLDYVFDLPGLEAEKAGMAGTFPSGFGYEEPTTCVAPEAVTSIAAILARRGYDAQSIAAVMGANWVRIAKACWGPSPA